MINTSNNFLLMIEPTSKKTKITKDKYTEMANFIFDKLQPGCFYKGFHVCVCGAHSDATQWKIQGYETNSLLVHYVEKHREEVPITELQKLESIFLKYKINKTNKTDSQNLGQKLNSDKPKKIKARIK